MWPRWTYVETFRKPECPRVSAHFLHVLVVLPMAILLLTIAHMSV